MKKKIIITLTLFFAFLVVISSCVFIRQKKFQKSLSASALTSHDFQDSFKFKLTNWILVNAKLNGLQQEQTFILDTGSPCTYSFKTKDESNLKTKKLFRLGTYKTDYGFSDAQIGNISYKKLQFLTMDFELFKWQKVSGIIGVNAMQNSVWEINFQDTIITVSDNLKSFKNISNAYRTKFKPYSEQQTPVVKLTINNKDTVTAFIDTGDPGFIRFNSDFNIISYKEKEPESVKTAYYDIDDNGKKLKKKSIYVRDQIKVNSLKIGEFELDSSIVQRVSLYKGRNLVGLDFLKNFIVTIDFKNYDLYLKPIEKTHFPKNIFTFGFECFKRKGFLEVDFIFKGSLAEKLGVKCGDKIVKVNNQAINDMDINTLKALEDYLPSDKEIVLVFKDKDKEIILKKVPLFNR
ncbi:MAG: hypothetical protein EBT39_04770 [Sphingobacteriia bacterium]|nr:hypothetical protein [Candidatus Fonsibacter lacus]